MSGLIELMIIYHMCSTSISTTWIILFICDRVPHRLMNFRLIKISFTLMKILMKHTVIDSKQKWPHTYSDIYSGEKLSAEIDGWILRTNASLRTSNKCLYIRMPIRIKYFNIECLWQLFRQYMRKRINVQSCHCISSGQSTCGVEFRECDECGGSNNNLIEITWVEFANFVLVPRLTESSYILRLMRIGNLIEHVRPMEGGNAVIMRLVYIIHIHSWWN